MSIESNQQPNVPVEPKAPYEAPMLRALGDLRMLTLGGSAGRGDSGSPSTQRVMRL